MKWIDKINSFPITEKIKVLFCGIVNGLFGGGGGMLVMPVLMKRTNDVHRAHATAPAVMLALSVCSAAFYIIGSDVRWDAVWKAAIGTSVGAAVGAFLLPKIKANVLSIVFAALMMAAGIRGLLS